MMGGAHGLARGLDESTLHEGNDRRVISVAWSRHVEVRSWRLPLGPRRLSAFAPRTAPLPIDEIRDM